MSEHPAWLNGWQRSSRGWELESVVRQGAGWETRLLPASWLVQNSRLFEPSARPFARSRSRSFQLRVPDLTRLSPLLEPGRLLTALVPPARRTRQAVYAAAGDGEQQVYVPATLLLRVLWMWNPSAMDALLTPNSLAMYLRHIDDAEGSRVEVSGPLARVGGSDTGLRRLSWLAQCADAQASWSSVLTFAHDGALRLRLPRASLEAWAWGIELPTGTLVAELSAVSLSFELPQEGCRVLLGSDSHRCPPVPQRRPGMVSF
jgi:hypothetical protein